ncbi:unnamed protein product [Moneuplotes crassus]|uniref:Aldehyde dehydrogenase domain-containing protein n=1 Tax=Euplotes crassus TaxID=5936 RepID=A0AAD1UDF8_EUPCR|nr:unnamed protein product [Moneuplotes crassus]
MLARSSFRNSKRFFGTRMVPKQTQLFIGGEWVNSANGDTFETINPYTEEPITSVQRASVEDVDRAVDAARNAFDHGPWRRMSGTERGDLLFKLAELIKKNGEELAHLEALDNGKPITLAKIVDVSNSYLTYKYYAGFANKFVGDTISAPGDFHAYTRKEPVGVAAQIIPWNVPMLMQAWKLAPALAAGCTVVMKTAEQTPLSALRVGELIKEAGFPDGVVNILSGFGEDAGAHLVRHPGVDKVAFTGSTEVGLDIMRNSSTSGLKRVTLELGGKSPFIICEDANIEESIQQANFSLFFNSGQVCIAASRLFVHEKIYDEFAEKSAKLASKAVLGNGLDPNTTQGPQISKEQQNKIWGYIQKGKQEGASCLTGGEEYEGKGFFVKPTVFADVQDDMTIAKEEIFGPVMQILKFSDYEDVIKRANNTDYGLGAGVITNDIGRAFHLTNGLRAGTVFVNCYDIFDPTLPFGGYKNSGLGRENGLEGLENYLETKTVIMSRPEGSLP